MFKRTKKKLSVLVVLAMVFTMLLGAVSPAAAASINPVVVGSVPTVTTTGETTLASIRYAETAATAGTFQEDDYIEVTLPDDVRFVGFSDTVDVDVAVYTDFLSISDITSDGINAKELKILAGGNTLRIVFGARTNLNKALSVLIKLPVDVDVKGSGDIEATVTSSNTALGEGELVVGTFGSGSVAVSRSTNTVPTISKFTTIPQSVSMRVRLAENVAGAFATGSSTANYVELRLPAGLTWENVTATGLQSSGEGTRNLRLWATSATTTRTTFQVSFSIAATRLAPLGEINVSVIGYGNNNDINADLVLFEVIEYGVTVRRQPSTNPRTVTAGKMAQSLAVLELVESAEGSLIPGGTVTLTLPSNAKWAVDGSDDPVAVESGSTGRLDNARLNANKTVLTFDVVGSGKDTVRFSFTNAINLGPKATGEIAVTVAGTAGAEGEVVLGTVRDIFTASASSIAGLRNNIDNQAAGDVVITEEAAGRIAMTGTGNIVLKALDAEFSKLPTVTVTTGNISLGTPVLSNGDTIVTIPVSSRSTVASTITISGIEYDVESGDGEIRVEVYGSALMDDDAYALFSAASARVRVTNARVGSASKSVFTVGSTTFIQDNQTVTMDVAPIIKNGRTLLPLRFAAVAAGVHPDQILWDPVRKAVTLIRGDRVAQVVIDSTTLLINGAAVTMDIAPEIIDGRTMLPIRWIALALRANVDWDATDKTITVIPY